MTRKRGAQALRFLHLRTQQMEDNRILFFDTFIEENDYLFTGTVRTLMLDFEHSMRIAHFNWGYLIETEQLDPASEITTIECVLTIDGGSGEILHRQRFGSEHHNMKTYDRDERYPVGSKVRLKRCSISC